MAPANAVEPKAPITSAGRRPNGVAPSRPANRGRQRRTQGLGPCGLSAKTAAKASHLGRLMHVLMPVHKVRRGPHTALGTDPTAEPLLGAATLSNCR